MPPVIRVWGRSPKRRAVPHHVQNHGPPGPGAGAARRGLRAWALRCAGRAPRQTESGQGYKVPLGCSPLSRRPGETAGRGVGGLFHGSQAS